MISHDSPAPANVLRRIAREFQPHWASLCLALLASVGVSASEGARIFLIKDVLDGLLTAENPQALWWLPLAIALVTALGGFLQAARGWFARQPTLKVMRDLRARIFAHMQALPLGRLRQYRSGDLASRLTHDVAAVNQGQTVLITLLQKPLTLVVLIATAAWHEPLLTAAGLVAVPLIGLPVVILSQRLRRRAREGQRAHGAMHTRLHENLGGVRVVRASGAEALEKARFQAENETVYQAQIASLAARLVASPLVASVAAIGAAVVLWLGAGRVSAGVSTTGSLIAFLLALGLIYDPIKSLTQVPLLTEQCRAGLERVYSLLDEAIPEEDGADGAALQAHTITLRWDGVWVDHGDGPVISGVDLEAVPGEILAIVGPSGAGKSTLVDLVPRLIEPNAGRVCINNVDIRQLERRTLRQHIALVTQETFLFHDTVAANIAFGCPASAEDIVCAAEAAGAAHFIESLPQGYDTVVGDRGARLSGGEAQRVALARAFLRKAPLILLDEATAHLDPESEHHLMETLRAWGDRTIVVISHRESTTRWADRVAHLDQGRLISATQAASTQEVA